MSTQNKEYESLLRDPRWQKRRLEFMSAKGWKCEMCGDDREELHVHHRSYIKGNRPWEYEDSWMECLCGTCHALRHLGYAKVEKYVYKQSGISERMARVEEIEKEARENRTYINHLIAERKAAHKASQLANVANCANCR